MEALTIPLQYSDYLIQTHYRDKHQCVPKTPKFLKYLSFSKCSHSGLRTFAISLKFALRKLVEIFCKLQKISGKSWIAQKLWASRIASFWGHRLDAEN